MRRLWRWVVHWQTVILFVAACVVFAAGLFIIGDLRATDARLERESSIRFCETANSQTVLIRDVLVAALRPPDPASYDYIPDPAARQGAIDQATASRAELRQQITDGLQPQDCAAQFPPPPNGDG